MSNRYAIDPTGYNNQYFMAAYNSPYTNYSAPAVTPAVEKKQEKKSNPISNLIVGTTLALGAAYLCKKAHGIGNGDTITKKILDGFKQWGNCAKNWFAKFSTGKP